MNLKIGDEVTIPFIQGKLSNLEMTGVVVGIMGKFCRVRTEGGSWDGKISETLKISREEGKKREFPFLKRGGRKIF